MGTVRRKRTVNNVRSELAPSWLTVTEVMRELRMGRSAIYRAIATGQIPSVRIGRTIRIPAAWLAMEAGQDPARDRDRG